MTTILFAVALAIAMIAVAWFAAIAKVYREQKAEWEHKFWQVQGDLQTTETILKGYKKLIKGVNETDFIPLEEMQG